MPAGVRLRFASDSPRLTLHITSDPEFPWYESMCVDIVIDGQLLATRQLSDAQLTVALPTGVKTIEVWLPQYGHLLMSKLELAPGSSLDAVAERRPRYMAYGSSITQCKDAHSPTQTWPALVARAHGLNLTALGFGGQCHLDTMIARLIRDTPAELITLCVGINIYDPGSLSARTLGPQLIGCLKLIREKQPTTPIVVISPIYAGFRETTPNRLGLTLGDIRQQLSQTVRALQQGDAGLSYLDGLKLLGATDAAHWHDGLHPDAAGYRLMALRMAEAMRTHTSQCTE
jgi:lysophospholipase L1-like esterase